MVPVVCVLRGNGPARADLGQPDQFYVHSGCPDGGQLLSVSPGRARSKEPDGACAQAVHLARGAAEEMAGPVGVGEHLGVTTDGDRVVTHRFSCLYPAYRGWCWAVTVARASRAKNVTIDETLLVPGPEAILAPDWVPWKGNQRRPAIWASETCRHRRTTPCWSLGRLAGGGRRCLLRRDDLGHARHRTGRPGSGPVLLSRWLKAWDDEYDVAPEDLDSAETVAWSAVAGPLWSQCRGNQP